MVLVIRGSERHKYRSFMDDLFRLRYEIFVARRQWSLPSRNEMDIDQYDNDDAVYFALTDDDGSIVAAARINHTVRSSLLADLFPFLIETGEPARGDGLYEGTRFIVNPKARSRAAVCRLRAELVSAVVEWCLDHGGTHLQAVIDANMLTSFVEMTMRTRPLGLAHDYGGGSRVPGGGSCLAFRWDLSDSLLDELRAYGGIEARDVPETVPFETIH